MNLKHQLHQKLCSLINKNYERQNSFFYAQNAGYCISELLNFQVNAGGAYPQTPP